MSRYFPPIHDEDRCHCDQRWFGRHHYGWEHDVHLFIPKVTGPAMGYPLPWGRSYEEHRVVASVIEALLQNGYRALDMARERTIAPGSRPDLSVIPDDGPVEFWEAKRGRPISKDRAQARRYLDVARLLWPDRPVNVFLVYPVERGSETLAVESFR